MNKVFEVRLTNHALTESAPYKERYTNVFVKATSIAEAVEKAEHAHPGLTVESVDTHGDSFIE